MSEGIDAEMVNTDESFAAKDEVQEDVEKRSDNLHSSLSESLFRAGNHQSSRRKRSKSVSFADTRGLSLEEVREFDGSTDFVVRRSFSSMTSHLNDTQPPKLEVEKYFLLFPQPSVNYRNFMRNLWTQNVSLHLAWVKNDQLIGSVFVVNLAYCKEVDLRVTFDSWKSFTHFKAKFCRSESDHLDVFDFSFAIPEKSWKVNFCVRYRCNGATYWDNNRGLDYCVAAHLSTTGEDTAGDTLAFVT